MSALPAFQFYPGDWRKNVKLRLCSLAARGAWMEVLCLMHDSDEYGLVRCTLEQLAGAAGVPLPLVQELAGRGVLKGADAGAPPYWYRPRHAGQLGEPVLLVDPKGGPVWFSSRMVEDEWRRSRRGTGTRFSSDRQPEGRENPKPTRRVGERVGDPVGGVCGGPVGNGAGGPTGVESGASGQNPPGFNGKATPTRRVGERQGDGPSSSSSASSSSVAKATAAPLSAALDASLGAAGAHPPAGLHPPAGGAHAPAGLPPAPTPAPSPAAAPSGAPAAGKRPSRGPVEVPGAPAGVRYAELTPEETRKRDVWRVARRLLAGFVPDERVGNVCGKLIKDFEFTVFAEAVTIAATTAGQQGGQLGNPIEFLTATCQRIVGERPSRTPSKQKALEDSNDVVLREWLAKRLGETVDAPK